MIEVHRPAASEFKINTKDDFELCFLRHQYFRRAKFNPSQEEMQPYMGIVENHTNSTFYTYYNLFKAVGMYQEDILNIGRVHLVSFLGLYTLERMDEKKKVFSENFLRYNYKEATQVDFDQKNKANFTMFFKQRMEDLVRVCRQKCRNVKGKSSDEYQVFSGPGKPLKEPRKLLSDYEKLGYKKVDFSVFKSIRKKANVNNDATMFKFGDLWYIAIISDNRDLDLEDIVSSGYDPYENAHNLSPDKAYEIEEMKSFDILFYKKSKARKVMTLKKFISKNKKRKSYQEEIQTAKKLLRSLGE